MVASLDGDKQSAHVIALLIDPHSCSPQYFIKWCMGYLRWARPWEIQQGQDPPALSSQGLLYPQASCALLPICQDPCSLGPASHPTRSPTLPHTPITNIALTFERSLELILEKDSMPIYFTPSEGHVALPWKWATFWIRHSVVARQPLQNGPCFWDGAIQPSDSKGWSSLFSFPRQGQVHQICESDEQGISP